jgi:capsular exopolysaccharide synthesis family protein
MQKNLKPVIEQKNDIVDLGRLFSTLWRKKLQIFFCMILAVALGGFYLFKVVAPLYKSTSVVVLETALNQFSGIESVVSGLSGDSEEVNTEVEILKSRRLMGKVVDRLDLINDPEFNESLRPPTVRQRLIGLVSNLIGENEEQAELDSEIRAQIERDHVIKVLLDSVAIHNVSLSQILEINAVTQDAQKSARIADTIAEIYILDQISVKFEETERAAKWLGERVVTFQRELEQAETALARYDSSIELVSVETLRAQETHLKNVRNQLLSLQAEIAQSASTLEILSGDVDRQTAIQIVNDPIFTANVARLPKTAEGQLAFEQNLQEVKDRLQGDQIRRARQAELFTETEQTLKEQLAQQSDELIQLQQLQREVEAVRLVYEHFLARLKETRAQQGVQQADSRVISPAVIPSDPAFPNKTLGLLLSALIGGFIGAGIALFRESLNAGFHDARDLESRFGLNVLGQVPLAPSRRRQKFLSYLIEKPTSALAESYRNLRTSVLMSNVENPPQVLVSTSCVPGEGKTSNSLGMAQNFTGMGKKVLVLEGDIRRRTLNEYFPNLENRGGVVSVMSGETALEEALYFDEEAGFHVLGGDRVSTNAADVLASAAFHTLVKDLREKFDIIIIDCPPVLVVPDARIIATVADATLFSVKWDSTVASLVEESLRLFETSGQEVTGFILGQINLKKNRGYGKYSSYGTYGGHYYSN